MTHNISRALEEFLSLYKQVYDYWKSHGCDEMTSLCLDYGNELLGNTKTLPSIIANAIEYRGKRFASKLEIASVGYAYNYFILEEEP